MANGAILTAEQERKLRQPIDEYVGKIQKEIDELREHGTAEVIEYQNLIANVKRDKTLSKGEKEYEIKESFRTCNIHFVSDCSRYLIM